MRHSVRPPTKTPATPAGTTAQPWGTWTTPYGELTPHGGEGARLMGAYYRTFLGARGLLPREGCAVSGDIVAWGQRQAAGDQDRRDVRRGPAARLRPEGRPSGQRGERPDLPPGRRRRRRRRTQGRPAPEARCGRRGQGPRRTSRCCNACWVVTRRPRPAAASSASLRTSQPTRTTRPDLGGALSIASTAGQTILLEYVEGKPMSEVGWGRVSKADIQAMLRFHPVKFHYEVGAPYIAERYAAPVAKEVLNALKGEGGTEGKLTMLVEPRHQHRGPARLPGRAFHRRRLSAGRSAARRGHRASSS
ncbi:hypothetical protein ACRAWD_20055 [Caulobacter segnis]